MSATEQYPNLEKLVAGMNERMRTFACIYLAMLPPDLILDIDRRIPDIIELENAGDDEGIKALIMSFGADEATAQQITDLRHEQ
jgi:hypothetical protein